MKQSLAIQFLVLASFAVAPACIAAPAASPAQQTTAAGHDGVTKGWELLQDNPHTGEWHVYLSSEGMAAQNKKMGCTLVTKAPQWNVVMYNDKTKVYFLSPLAEWKGAQGSIKGTPKARQVYRSASNSLIERPPKKLRDDVILGHKTTVYLTDNLVTTGLKKVEFSITPEIEAPSQLKQVFGKIYGVGLTKLTGLPLRVSYIDENGKRSPVFDTRKVEQRDVPLTKFDFPANYKKVDSEIAVLMDEKGREAMQSIMSDLNEEGEDLDNILEEKQPKNKKHATSASDFVDGEPSTTSAEDSGKGSPGENNTDTIFLIGAVTIICIFVGGTAFYLLKNKPA